jgi:hypothetical protein
VGESLQDSGERDLGLEAGQGRAEAPVQVPVRRTILIVPAPPSTRIRSPSRIILLASPVHRRNSIGQ